jgi:hypothetical protein
MRPSIRPTSFFREKLLTSFEGFLTRLGYLEVQTGWESSERGINRPGTVCPYRQGPCRSMSHLISCVSNDSRKTPSGPLCLLVIDFPTCTICGPQRDNNLCAIR